MGVARSGLLHDFADHHPDLRGGGEHGPELLVQHVLEPRLDVVLGEGVGHRDGEALGPHASGDAYHEARPFSFLLGKRPRERFREAALDVFLGERRGCRDGEPPVLVAGCHDVREPDPE